MQDQYDKQKTAALIKEAQEITCQLRAETESLERQMEKVLCGGEDEPLGALEGNAANVVHDGAGRKSFWQLWRH